MEKLIREVRMLKIYAASLTIAFILLFLLAFKSSKAMNIKGLRKLMLKELISLRKTGH